MPVTRPPFYPTLPYVGPPLYRQWPKFRTNFDSETAIVLSSYQDGDPPEAALTGLAFGEEESRRQFRLFFYEGYESDAAFKIQINDGSDSREIWRDIVIIHKDDSAFEVRSPRFDVNDEGVVRATAFYSLYGDVSSFVVRQSDGSRSYNTDTLTFNRDSGFYLTSDSAGKPIVNINIPESTTIASDFYLVVKQTDDLQSFTNLNVIAFNADDFYLTQQDTDEVIVNVRGGATGPAGPAGPAGEQGPSGSSFYLTVKHDDDSTSFSGINVVGFDTNYFYVIQNDPNTDEVTVNFRGATGTVGPQGPTGDTGPPGPGFYLTVKQTDDLQSFSSINVVAFNSDNFYITQNDPNTDEVIVHVRGDIAGPTGPQGIQGPAGATGPAGGGFYLTAKHTDDSVSFSGLNIFGFNVNDFYLTQNDPNTDEVIINLRVDTGPQGETGPAGAQGPQGIQGPQGPAGPAGSGSGAVSSAAETFVASREWALAHNFYTTDIFWQVWDDSQEYIIPEAVDASQPDVTYFYFLTERSGRALVIDASGGAAAATTTVSAFYLTVKHDDDSASFSDLSVIGFNVNDFYLTQNDPNTDEVLVNIRGGTVGPAGPAGAKGDTGDTGATGDTGPQGPGFYLTVKQEDDLQSFSGLNVIAFEAANFYLTQNDPNTDEVMVNLRGGAQGPAGPTGAAGATGAQGPAGPGFYLTTKHTDDSASFSGLNVIAFDVENFYLTQNDPNTDEVVVNLRGTLGGGGTTTITVDEVDGGSSFTEVSRLRFNEGDGFYLSSDSLGNPVVNVEGFEGPQGPTGPKGDKGAFYLTVCQTDGLQSYGETQWLSFNATDFYLTQGTDLNEAIVNVRGTVGSGGTSGTASYAQSFTDSVEWQLPHNLSSSDILWAAYDDSGEAIIPGKIDINDPNTTYFYFDIAQTGRAVVSGGIAVPSGVQKSQGTFGAAVEWQLNHNLGTPLVIWSAYDSGYKAIIPGEVDVSNPNTAYFYFDIAQAGIAVVIG